MPSKVVDIMEDNPDYIIPGGIVSPNHAMKILHENGLAETFLNLTKTTNEKIGFLYLLSEKENNEPRVKFRLMPDDLARPRHAPAEQQMLLEGAGRSVSPAHVIDTLIAKGDGKGLLLTNSDDRKVGYVFPLQDKFKSGEHQVMFAVTEPRRVPPQQQGLVDAQRELCERRVRSTLAKAHPEIMGADLEAQVKKAAAVQLKAERENLLKHKITIMPRQHDYVLVKVTNRGFEEISYHTDVKEALKEQQKLILREDEAALTRVARKLSHSPSQPQPVRRSPDRDRGIEKGPRR